ncbi:hypothetical protein [Streptococcus orisratti]
MINRRKGVDLVSALSFCLQCEAQTIARCSCDTRIWNQVKRHGAKAWKLYHLYVIQIWNQVKRHGAKASEVEPTSLACACETVGQNDRGGEFFGKRERQKRGCNPSLAEHNQKWLCRFLYCVTTKQS